MTGVLRGGHGHNVLQSLADIECAQAAFKDPQSSISRQEFNAIPGIGCNHAAEVLQAGSCELPYHNRRTHYGASFFV